MLKELRDLPPLNNPGFFADLVRGAPVVPIPDDVFEGSSRDEPAEQKRDDEQRDEPDGSEFDER